MHFDHINLGTCVLGLKSSNSAVTKEIYQLNDNAAPSASVIAKAPMGSIWFKATPVSGDYMAYTKITATTVAECMAIA